MFYNIFLVFLLSAVVPFCVGNGTQQELVLLDQQEQDVQSNIDDLLDELQECEERIALTDDSVVLKSVEQRKEAILAHLEELSKKISTKQLGNSDVSVSLSGSSAGEPNVVSASKADGPLQGRIELVEKQFIAIKTMLFDKSVMSIAQQTLFERFNIFIAHIVEDVEQALVENDERHAEALVLVLEQVAHLVKKIFIKLECLTVGKAELSPLYGVVSCPLVFSEVQHIALRVVVALIEYLERYVWAIGHEGFMLNSELLHQVLTDSIITFLPSGMKSAWWGCLLCGGRKNSEFKGVKKLIAYDLYEEDQDLCEKYLMFKWSMREAERLGRENDEVTRHITASLQRSLVNKIRYTHAHNEKNSIKLIVLETLLFTTIKSNSASEALDKMQHLPAGSAKQEMLLKHKLLCGDELLRGIVSTNREFAEYYQRYCRIVENYLASDKVSFDMMYDLYALVKHLKRMHGRDQGTGNVAGPTINVTWLELAWFLAKAKAVKDFIWSNANIASMLTCEMLENLEFIASTLHEQGRGGSFAQSQGLIASIMHGNWATQQGNSYIDKIKVFFSAIVQGNIEEAKQQMLQILGSATPLVSVMFLKMLMPAISGPLKKMAKYLILSWLEDDKQDDKQAGVGKKQKPEETLAGIIALLQKSPQLTGLFDVGKLVEVVQASQAQAA